MKLLLAIAIFGLTPSSNTETLSFPSFRIEIDEGWVYDIQRGPQAHEDWGDLISISYPNGIGILKLQSYRVQDSVSKEILRNLTNVDLSKSLTWKSWGDYSGYHYSYLERGSVYRQWWLTNERTIIFITYSCDAESKDIEIQEISKIVNSIRVNKL